MEEISLLRKEKVISSNEMRRIESLAIKQGQDDKKFMLEAGKNIFNEIKKILNKKKIKKVVLLIGKGNNGGDAYVTGLHLLENDFSVKAYQLFDIDNCSELCKLFHDKFKKKKGKIVNISSYEDMSFHENELIIDGILGTGFQNKLDDYLLNIIEKINSLKNLIVSIDIPSGLDGNTGKKNPIAVKANYTIFLSFPKVGYFLEDGWDYCGRLVKAEFGLDEKYKKQAKESFYLINEENINKFLPKIERKRHKYQAGSVIGIGGSISMKGALQLSGQAVLHSGAGIIRLLVTKEVQKEITSPMELIYDSWDDKNSSDIINMCNNAKAIFLGPGMGRDNKVYEFLNNIIPYIEMPCVIDADALYFLSKYPECKLPKKAILTPHKKEMLRLLDKEKEESNQSLLNDTQNYSNKKNVIIVLKGAPTFIFIPNEVPFVLHRGDPGMATAGTGDVLTGIITSFLAQGCSLIVASVIGSWIHAIAGEIASKEKTPYCMVASDIIEYLPKAFKYCGIPYTNR